MFRASYFGSPCSATNHSKPHGIKQLSYYAHWSCCYWTVLRREGLSEWTWTAVGWSHLKAASLTCLHLNRDDSKTGLHWDHCPEHGLGLITWDLDYKKGHPERECHGRSTWKVWRLSLSLYSPVLVEALTRLCRLNAHRLPLTRRNSKIFGATFLKCQTCYLNSAQQK